MPGTFIVGEKKTRPGVYYRYENTGGVATAGANNGVLAVLFKANWGPLNTQVELDASMRNNAADYFGTGQGVSIIEEGFLGGATTIRAVRVGGDDGTKSTIKLKDEDNTDAVSITAKYVGARAFTVSIRTNIITGERQCVIYDGTEIFEQVSFAAGTAEQTNLVAAFANSKNFVAALESSDTGKVLASVTQAAMTAGTNPTVSTNSYSAGTDELERYKWNCIVADSDEAAVHALLSAFVSQSYETGHLGMACVGGLKSQSLDTRMQVAAAFNDEKIVYVLHGWKDSSGAEYDGWKAAARIGGMVATFATNTSLTHDVIKNAVALLEPLTNGETIKAEQKGCLCLSLNDEDQVWVDSAINTLITPAANQDEGWKKIRRVKSRFELMDRVDTTCNKLVGKVNNDTDGRQTIMAAAQNVINEMVSENKIFAGSLVYEDPAHKPEGDSCWFKLAIDDIDSAEKIYLTYQFRFSQES